MNRCLLHREKVFFVMYAFALWRAVFCGLEDVVCFLLEPSGIVAATSVCVQWEPDVRRQQEPASSKDFQVRWLDNMTV